MTRTYSWLVDKLSPLLEPDERDAVCGDFAESGLSGGMALRNMLGLVVRRQLALWRDWRPWLALAGLVAPVGVLLTAFAGKVGMLGRQVWNNAEYWTELTSGEYVEAAALACMSVALVLWAWTSGFVLGSLARRTAWVHGVLFFLALSGFNTWVVFTYPFKVVAPALISHAVLLLLPSIWGVRWGLRIGTLNVRQAIPVAAPVVATTLFMIWIQTWWQGAGDVAWLKMLPGLAVVCWPTVYIVATAGWQRKLENVAERDSI